MPNKNAAIASEETVNNIGQSQISEKKRLFYLNNFPEAMTHLPQWTFWKFGKLNPNTGKRDKLPLSKDGSFASIDDPSTWATILQLIKAHEANPSKFDGIRGFMFALRQDDPFVFIDLDHCLEDGELKPDFPISQKWLDKFETYKDITQSSEGLHIICRIEDKSKYERSYLNRKSEGIEVYLSRRFCVFTGNLYSGQSVIEDCTEIFDKFLQAHGLFKPGLKTGSSSKKATNQFNSVSIGDAPYELNLRTYDAIWAEYWESIRPRAKQADRKSWLYEYPLHEGRSPKRLIWDKRRKRPHDNAGLSERGLLIEEFSEGSEIVARFDELEEKKVGSQTTDLELEEFVFDEDEDEGDGIVIPSFDDIQPITFLVDKLIPNGEITILAGEGGCGKSYALAAIASAVSKGHGFPLSGRNKPGTVLIYSAEDRVDKVIAPRLRSFGANPNNFRIRDKEAFSLSGKGLLKLKADIERHRPSMVIIDPATSFCYPLNLEIRGNCETFFRPIDQLAGQYDIPIIFTVHFNKGSKDENIKSRIAGSAAIVDFARSVLIMTRHPANPNHKVITQIKHNYSGAGNTLECCISEDGLFEWRGTSDVTSEDLVANRNRSLERFILEKLDSCEDMLSIELEEECIEAYGVSKDQVRYARERLGITRDNGCVFQKRGSTKWYVKSPSRKQAKLLGINKKFA